MFPPENIFFHLHLYNKIHKAEVNEKHSPMLMPVVDRNQILIGRRGKIISLVRKTKFELWV